MPPVLAPAIIALAAGIGVELGATAAATIAYGVVTIASIGASFAFNRLTSRKREKGDPQISQFTIRQPLPVRTRGYGRNKIGGALFFQSAIPAPNAALQFGMIHCEGRVDAIESWWLNNSNTAIAAGSLGGGNAAPPWFNFVSLESRLGDDVQGVNTLLAGLGWTGTQNGLCYTVMQCQQPPQPAKFFQYFYPNGLPALRVVVRCAKVFDPRDGTQNWNSPGTWKWSRNPALIIMDYLTFARTDANGIAIPRGMGLQKSRISVASFSAFANICDQPVSTIYAYDANGNVILSPGTEPRYSCDGMYDMSETPTDVLQRMLATCDGTLHTLADGTIGIRGGVWDAPTVTINDSMILSVDFSQGNDKFTSFNQLKIGITASNMDYQVVEGDPWDDVDSQDIDGVLAQDLSLPFVQSYSQARRLAKIQMAKGNPRWRYNSLVCTLAALNALGEQFIHVTHSIAGIDEDFLVLNFKLIGGATCELQLASIDSSAFDWTPATEDLPPPSTNPNGIVDVAPDVPVISQVLSGDAAIGFETVSNPDPVIVLLQPGGFLPIAEYEVRHRIVGASVWNSTSEAASAGHVVLSGYVFGDDVEMEARAISPGGHASAFSAATTHIVGGTISNAGGITALLALGVPVDMGGVGEITVAEDLANERPPSYFVDLDAIARR